MPNGFSAFGRNAEFGKLVDFDGSLESRPVFGEVTPFFYKLLREQEMGYLLLILLLGAWSKHLRKIENVFLILGLVEFGRAPAIKHNLKFYNWLFSKKLFS